MMEQRLAGERQILLGQACPHARAAAGGGYQGKQFRHGRQDAVAVGEDCISTSMPYRVLPAAWATRPAAHCRDEPGEDYNNRATTVSSRWA